MRKDLLYSIYLFQCLHSYCNRVVNILYHSVLQPVLPLVVVLLGTLLVTRCACAILAGRCRFLLAAARGRQNRRARDINCTAQGSSMSTPREGAMELQEMNTVYLLILTHRPFVTERFHARYRRSRSRTVHVTVARLLLGVVYELGRTSVAYM